MGSYEDIIHLPHHQSARRPHMPLSERAAQFSPFAALTGYDAAIDETGRLTEAFMEPDENVKERLDETLRYLELHQSEHPEVTVRHFVPDELKEGGAYETLTGRFVKVDAVGRRLHLEGDVRLDFDKIVGLWLGRSTDGEGEGFFAEE